MSGCFSSNKISIVILKNITAVNFSSTYEKLPKSMRLSAKRKKQKSFKIKVNKLKS